MRVDVRADVSQALKKLNLAKGEAKRAIQRALNKTANTARAQSAREIKAAGYGLKIGDIKKAITVRRASTAELHAILHAIGRPIPLIQYAARQNSSGVTVKVKNGRKSIQHAFIATMPSGHRGVFVRVQNAGHAKMIERAIAGGRGRVPSGKKHGLPIKELYGPSIPTAFANEVVMNAMKAAIHQRFPVVLAQELRYLQSKLSGSSA